MKTSIQWCDHSVNPIRARHIPTGKVGHYCEKIAGGCANCYSSRMQIRFGTPQFGSGQKRAEYELFLDESKLKEVRRRKKPTRYFWCDMTDIFGDWMLPEWMSECFATMDATPQHTHILLTKRPENVRRMWPHEGFYRRVFQPSPYGMQNCDPTPKRLNNVWLLTSVSDQPTADAMIPPLLKCRDLVPVLGVSYEPAVGPVDFSKWLGLLTYAPKAVLRMMPHGAIYPDPRAGTTVKTYPSKLDWVIIGGESGHGARPFDLAWARSTVQQCKAAGVACFVKQLGAMPVGGRMTPQEWRLRDKKGGDWNEWPEDLRVREWPQA